MSTKFKEEQLNKGLLLLPTEQIITYATNRTVVLTNMRLCQERRGTFSSMNKNIMLEHITSCYNKSKYNWFFVLLALGGIIAIAIGSSNNEGSLSGTGLIVLVVSVILFFVTRKNFIVIGSPSERMVVNVKGMNRTKVMEFINKIEEAKHHRLLILQK